MMGINTDIEREIIRFAIVLFILILIFIISFAVYCFLPRNKDE